MRSLSVFLIFVSMSLSCVLDLSDDDTATVEETIQPLAGSYDTCDPPEYNGKMVRCIGSNCSSGTGWCQCDGNYKHCAPAPCSVSLPCQAGNSPVSCSGTSCSVLGPPNNKVCGGVSCNGVEHWCPPLPGDLECY